MSRPVTLFTGQWADLPFEEVARLAGEWGYDGLEIACWGDHFDVWAAVEDDGYVAGRREVLDKHGLQVFAISNHLTGQAVCDPIDERHEAILPPEVWGDGDPEGVRRRAADWMKDTARAGAQRTVALIDSTKFGRQSLLTIMGADEPDLIITDPALEPDVATAYVAAGVALEILSTKEAA